MNQTPELPGLPYPSFGPQLEAVLETVANRTSREPPAILSGIDGAAFIVEAVARVIANSYQTVKFLCSEDDAVEKRPEFVLSLPPLTRSMVDALFLLIFLLENPAERTPRYFRGGWRELAEELARYRALYGDNEGWREWIEEFSIGIDRMAAEAKVTAEEREDLTLLPYWPTPGQMLRERTLSSDVKSYLQFLDAWYYKYLSSNTHLSWPGLILRSAALLPYHTNKERRDWRLDKQRSDAMAVACVLSLAAATEVNASLGYGLEERLSYIWGILNGYLGLARELWDRRYAALCVVA